MVPVCTVMPYLFPLFIHLSWEENNSFVNLESGGIKCTLLAESKNMKLEVFLKGAVGLEVKNLRKTNISPNQNL